MPYQASWVLFDQLYRKFNSGLMTEGEYLSEKWHLDYKYVELLHTRGLLSTDELRAQRQTLWNEMSNAEVPVLL